MNQHFRIHFLVFFSFVFHQIFKFDRMPKFEDVEDDPAKINAVVGQLMIILCKAMFVNFFCCQNPYGCLKNIILMVESWITLLAYFMEKIQILALKFNPLLDVKWEKTTFFFCFVLGNRIFFFNYITRGKVIFEILVWRKRIWFAIENHITHWRKQFQGNCEENCCLHLRLLHYCVIQCFRKAI